MKQITRQFYDPTISTDYPNYFCRGVRQSAKLLHILSSKTENGNERNRYKISTSDYLIKGSPTKLGSRMRGDFSDYDFNAHTVNEMFEFLGVLSHMGLVESFGEKEIYLNPIQVTQLEKVGNGDRNEDIYQQIQRFDFTSHAKTNGFRLRSLPAISG